MPSMMTPRDFTFFTRSVLIPSIQINYIWVCVSVAKYQEEDTFEPFGCVSNVMYIQTEELVLEQTIELLHKFYSKIVIWSYL